MNKNVIVLILTMVILLACSNDETSYTPPPNFQSITVVNHLPLIASCEDNSGTVESSGLDVNENFLLDESEINDIKIVCDGPLPEDPANECDNENNDEHEDNGFTCKHHKHGFHCKRKKK